MNLNIPNITVTETHNGKGLRVVADDGYTTQWRKDFRAVMGGSVDVWRLLDDPDAQPVKSYHFTLRYQIHKELNP